MSALLGVYNRLDLDLVGARGTRLFLADGRELLDLYGGHAVTPLGHGHPELREALTKAHETLDFYSNSVRMPVQEEAGRAVLGGSEHLRRVHFVNSGTEANEAAIHLARKLTGRARIVTLHNSFHGRTLGSLSVTGLTAYRRRVPLEIPEGWRGTIRFNHLEDLETLDDSVAGVLVESVPSIGGVLMPNPEWLRALAARARELGAMLIFDEVQGGVGRLGRWYAHEVFGVKPDMVTLAKSLGGGFPVGAMVCTEEVASQVGFSEIGTTFGGGPMAAAMVSTVARIIRRDGLMDRVMEIFTAVSEGLSDLDGVEVRGRGCLIGIQSPLPASRLRDALLERGIIVGTSGEPHSIRLLLPYIVSDAEIANFLTVTREVLGD